MTLELLMHDLDPSVSETFRGGQTLQEVHERTGINHIFADFKCDDFLFNPMGYSLNAVGGSEYYTFHVTPEKMCSYASFETNHLFDGDLAATVNRVLEIFKPASFAMVLFEKRGLELCLPAGYHTREDNLFHTCGYRVHFRDLAL